MCTSISAVSPTVTVISSIGSNSGRTPSPKYAVWYPPASESTIVYPASVTISGLPPSVWILSVIELSIVSERLFMLS